LAERVSTAQVRSRTFCAARLRYLPTNQTTEAEMSTEFDLEGAIVQFLATAMATGFYGALAFAVFNIATGA
jgi:hypothetical protein